MDKTPKYQNLTYQDYVNCPDVFMITPMKAKVCDPNNIPQAGYIAEQKFDGIRCYVFVTTAGCRLFTANIAVNGWLNEISDQFPHLRDLVYPELAGTVLDGELTTPDRKFRTIQGLTVSLPEKAITDQEKNGWALFNAFDILKICGTDIQGWWLEARKMALGSVLKNLSSPYIQNVKWFYGDGKTDFKELLKQYWAEGKEGLIIKDFHSPYEQKKSKHWLKLKGIKTFDVVIMGYAPPTKEYDGKTPLEKWPYWVNEPTIYPLNPNHMIPVTKPYYYNYPGAITFGVYKEEPNMNEYEVMDTPAYMFTKIGDKYYRLVKVGECRGFSDKVAKTLRDQGDNYLGRVIEVKAQEIEDLFTGSLRHPRFSRWRPDKNSWECTFENHLEAGK